MDCMDCLDEQQESGRQAVRPSDHPCWVRIGFANGYMTSPSSRSPTALLTGWLLPGTYGVSIERGQIRSFRECCIYALQIGWEVSPKEGQKQKRGKRKEKRTAAAFFGATRKRSFKWTRLAAYLCCINACLQCCLPYISDRIRTVRGTCRVP